MRNPEEDPADYPTNRNDKEEEERSPPPFKVLENVGVIAYKLELPQELSRVHNTFHELVEVMDHEVKRLKQSRILIVKVRWNSRRGSEFTWEREDQFQKKRSMKYKTRDTLVVVILEVICIKDLVALHFGEPFVMDYNLCHPSALTATADVPAMYIQQIWKTVKQVSNANNTILETPDNPFIEPADLKFIQRFLKIVGYEGIVDKVSAFYTKNLAQPWQTMFKDDDSEEDQEEDDDDGDTFDIWDITVEDLERIKKFFNVPDEIDDIVQLLIPEPIHTTPPNDDYVAPVTKSMLDELLE
ncbi:hypothetical protein Tco_0145345 [Tanacetum coccineum]